MVSNDKFTERYGRWAVVTGAKPATRVGASVDIDRPVEDVFSHWSEVERHPEWADTVLERRKITDGPWGVGSQIHAADQWPGRKVEHIIEITAYEPNRLMAGSWSEPMPGTMRARFEPTEAGTRLDFTIEASPTGVTGLIAPLFKGMATRRMEKFLTAFKHSVESGNI